MALKDLIATETDLLAAERARVVHLRELLRDVYDVARFGGGLSEGLISRVRREMASGRRKD